LFIGDDLSQERSALATRSLEGPLETKAEVVWKKKKSVSDKQKRFASIEFKNVPPEHFAVCFKKVTRLDMPTMSTPAFQSFGKLTIDMRVV